MNALVIGFGIPIWFYGGWIFWPTILMGLFFACFFAVAFIKGLRGHSFKDGWLGELFEPVPLQALIAVIIFFAAHYYAETDFAKFINDKYMCILFAYIFVALFIPIMIVAMCFAFVIDMAFAFLGYFLGKGLNYI